jgi:hypothetical protein
MFGHSVGLNLMSIKSVVSCAFGAHFHLRIAFSADWARTGWPPTILSDFTDPFGAITTSIFTLPVMFILRASSGYIGATLLTILRLLSPWSCWAKPHEHHSRVLEIAHAMRINLTGRRTLFPLYPSNLITSRDILKVTIVRAQQP